MYKRQEVNNSVVGLWYTALVLLFLLFGGVLAVLMRIQLARPGNTFLSPEMYNQIFTLHGSIMICLLYTSDAADERSSVDLGGRRIIKTKKQSRYTCERSV